MTGIRISEFDLALSLSGAEIFPIVQNGENKITTLNSLSSVIVSTKTPVFITDVINNTGLIQKTYKPNTVPANYVIDYITVDTGDSLTVTLQWDGPADEWTGLPLVNEQQISINDVSAVGTSTRRYKASKTIALAGANRTITAEVGTGSHTISAVMLGDGPVITNVTFGDTPVTKGYQPDFFMHGDTLDVTVEFDTDDVKSVTLYSGTDYATPNQVKNITVTNTTPPSATFTTTVDTASLGLTNLKLKVSAKNAFGSQGPVHESVQTISAKQGPTIQGLSIGSYPGAQTELKDGDLIDVTVEFDTNNVSGLEFDGHGGQYSTTTTNLSSTVQMIVGTDDLSPVDVSLKVKAKSSHNKFGDWFVSSETIKVCNQYPTYTGWEVIYPENQLALKQNETADVSLTIENQGNSPIYSYTAPGSQISVPATSEYSVNKTVTCTNPEIYNITTDNFQVTTTRTENNATSTYSNVVLVADQQPTITVSHNAGARMRSGGNQGTDPQQYTVTITSDQSLKSFEMQPGGGGVFTSSNWVGSSNNTTWTMNSIEIHDDDIKGDHTWTAIECVNLSNMTKQTVDAGSTYTLGGFVQRTIVVSRLSRYATLGTRVSNPTKLVYSHSWPGNWSFDTTLANGTQLNKSIVPFTGTDIELKYTIVDSTNDEVVQHNGDTVFILDLEAVNANNNTISPAQVTISEVV